MNEEITVSTALDGPSMLPGYKWHRRKHAWKRWGIYLVLTLVLSSIGYLNLRNSERNPEQQRFLILLPGFIVFAIWLTGLTDKNRFLKSIARLPGHGEQMNWFITSDGLRHQLGKSNGFTEWTLTDEALITPEGTLVYPQKNLFWWFPKQAFASAPDYIQFLNIVKEKTKHSTVG